MVDIQLKARGISDEKLIAIMAIIPRHLFISGKKPSESYGDYPLSIGCRQTISQPYMVAVMTELLRLTGREKVLEVGTGSGYQTAVLAELAQEVYTVERIPQLLKRSKKLLTELGYPNIYFRSGDGSRGWPEAAPFDSILVTAAASSIPPELKEQLADNGILVIPVGSSSNYQQLTVLRRSGNHFTVESGLGCRFVPLVRE
ncbi:MAG: protein-L-isoaspartate(D-aspartate) O-methyltransferase [Spirochaeta sp.]|nr:protein-L-isoaspartate(D-aspartate) O-methyltransferase [Spirochaeta sp.]